MKLRSVNRSPSIVQAQCMWSSQVSVACATVGSEKVKKKKQMRTSTSPKWTRRMLLAETCKEAEMLLLVWILYGHNTRLDKQQESLTFNYESVIIKFQLVVVCFVIVCHWQTPSLISIDQARWRNRTGREAKGFSKHYHNRGRVVVVPWWIVDVDVPIHVKSVFLLFLRDNPDMMDAWHFNMNQLMVVYWLGWHSIIVGGNPLTEDYPSQGSSVGRRSTMGWTWFT